MSLKMMTLYSSFFHGYDGEAGLFSIVKTIKYGNANHPHQSHHFVNLWVKQC